MGGAQLYIMYLAAESQGQGPEAALGGLIGFAIALGLCFAMIFVWFLIDWYMRRK